MILRELEPFQYNILEKKKKPGVLMTIGGIFQRANTPNANGRVYSEKLWKDILSRDDTKERIESRQMVGMLGHPTGPTDPSNVSHIVTRQELKSDGAVYGESDILDTPSGRIVATLFDAGVKLGISSRGDGSVKKEGGKDEVQKDFRLETYDFVLKPSTPGAYPGIVEDVEVNEKLVVDAIEGLVNSELAENQRVPVLLESLKILSVLDSSTTVDQVQSLSRLIQEALSPKTILTVEAKEVPNDHKTTQQETAMNVNGTQVEPTAPQQIQAQPQINDVTLQWHQAQIDTAVAAALAQKDEEVKKIKDDLLKSHRRYNETRKRLDAAEGLIEGFIEQVKTLEESGQPADERLQVRYNAAVELLDEALIQLPKLGEARSRVTALEGLLEASIGKFQEERVTEAVKACIVKVRKDLHETVEPLLEDCSTPEKVYETFKALVALNGRGTAQRTVSEPLPLQGTSLNEGAPAASPASSTFSGRLQARLTKAV